MSKTIDLQIEKCRTLIDGLRKNIGELADKGINNEELNRMGAELDRLTAASRECDEMRSQLSLKVKNMNAILAGVKESYIESKRKIKTNYPQEQWLRYGVLDKR